jgi:DNA-binding SARP family transcriptional activator
MVEFQILGPLEVAAAGSPVVLGGPKPCALLAALLLLRPGPVVSTDRLVCALWGMAPPPGAVGALLAYASRLRATLPDGSRRLIYQAPGYLLRVDAADIDADGHLARLAELLLVAAEERADALLHLGRGREVVPELETPVRAFPARDRLSVLLMKSLYAAGRQADALAVYRTQKHIVIRDDDPHPAPGGALSALSHVIHPHARPSANVGVGRMRWGDRMSHSSGGKPPCSAA